MTPSRIRLLVHALDRTGPPMLALAFARWLLDCGRQGSSIEVVAFRGGPLLDTFSDLGPVHVLLDPSEPWDHAEPDRGRVEVVRRRASGVVPADVMLAVSVAAGQVLPYLPRPMPPLVTWSVEQGEDLHWVTAGLGLVEHTAIWLAGSEGTREEVEQLLGEPGDVRLSPEFVELPAGVVPQAVANRRTAMGADGRRLLVVGAGIATVRKAPDLFLEVALELRRRGADDVGFVWIGGERDEMFPRLLQEVDRLGLRDVRFLGNVEDVVPWIAAADVMVHPARLDSFPLVCLHAALAGTPVVGFEGVGGLVEMLGEATAGVPYPDVAALADLVERMRDDDVRASLAAAQRDRVVERFTSVTAAPVLMEHLTAAVGGAA